MEAFFSFLKVTVICITVLIALVLVLAALPRCPFREFLLSLTKRVGATVGGLALAPPMDMIPVAGEVYDLAALIFLCWYWYTFFKEIGGLPPRTVARQ
jgi:hypothetical protein